MASEKWEQWKRAEPSERQKAKIRKIIYYQSLGYSDSEITKEIGCGITYVRQLRQREWFQKEANRVSEKLPAPVGKRYRRMEDSDLKRLRELHAEGLSDYQIADVIGFARRTVTTRRNDLGLRPNIRCRYTEEEIDLMIKLRVEDHKTYEQISIALGGRCPSAIRRAIDRHVLGATVCERYYEARQKKMGLYRDGSKAKG